MDEQRGGYPLFVQLNNRKEKKRIKKKEKKGNLLAKRELDKNSRL